jgi:hypothetical protein
VVGWVGFGLVWFGVVWLVGWLVGWLVIPQLSGLCVDINVHSLHLGGGCRISQSVQNPGCPG